MRLQIFLTSQSVHQIWLSSLIFHSKVMLVKKWGLSTLYCISQMEMTYYSNTYAKGIYNINHFYPPYFYSFKKNILHFVVHKNIWQSSLLMQKVLCGLENKPICLKHMEVNNAYESNNVHTKHVLQENCNRKWIIWFTIGYMLRHNKVGICNTWKPPN